MNKYFRTIGFLDISTRRILEKAVNKSIADYMNNQDKQPSRIVEIEIECHEHFGVMIHGECIDEEDFYVDYIIPFVRSKNYYSYINAKEENAVQMDSFFIRATFGKMNTELTFFVENSLDYVKERKHIGKKMVGLVGMAKQGEILMPVVPYNPKEDEEIERSDDILSISALKASLRYTSEEWHLTSFEARSWSSRTCLLTLMSLTSCLSIS